MAKAELKPEVEKTKKPKIERLRQNGVTRPGGNGKCQFVWDTADKLSAKHGRPALRDEVIAAVLKERPDSSVPMIGTNYSLWVRFHNAAGAIKQYRDSLNAEKHKAKAAKEAEKKANAEAAKAKADKAAAAKAKKGEAKAPAKKSA